VPTARYNFGAIFSINILPLWGISAWIYLFAHSSARDFRRQPFIPGHELLLNGRYLRLLPSHSLTDLSSGGLILSSATLVAQALACWFTLLAYSCLVEIFLSSTK